MVKGQLGIKRVSETPSQKQNANERGGGMSQVIECFLS
jgi:hypothetical protein